MANKKRVSDITPDQIINRRGSMDTETAAAVIGYSVRQWRNFENGTTSMPNYLFAEFERLAPPAWPAGVVRSALAA